MFTRVLVPLDRSDNAERALPYARALARTLEIPVTLITVVETAADLFPKKVHDLDTRIQESMKTLRNISRKYPVHSPGPPSNTRWKKAKPKTRLS